MIKSTISDIATKKFVSDEVEKLRIRMDSKFADVQETLEELKENDKKIDRVLEQLDSIAGQFKKFDEERVLMSDKISTHTDQIEALQNVVFAN